MPLSIVYRQAARRDIIEAARSFERERSGLAAAFIDVRRATLRRFPYGLFYLEERNRILVLACIDLRRNPEAIAQLVGRR